jgi:hypothetical protein
MYKTKLCSFALAAVIGFAGISPVSVIAAETNTESVTQSKKDNDHQGKRAAFEEKMKIANEKWEALSDKQKKEVFALLENEIKAEIKLMDQLVTFDVLQKEDVEMYKAFMQNRFKQMKENEEFPLYKQPAKKSRK